ncbi:MAG TPA: 2-dehydropantoate 2-reductase N-terminal domain-containing protein, partial [Candidatus Aquicultoraceae bacterium]|nr:2-dehydropantoate 2-reductase N-terminal domain-containing protein [Candidatus Aquicultoraceae bacterium]
MKKGRGERIAVVGGGSWGTAFSAMLSARNGDVSLWVREPEVCEAIRDRRENTVFLPGVKVPEEVRPSTDPAEALEGRGVVALAVPSQYLRGVAERIGPHIAREAVLVSLAKGLENGTLLRMTQVLEQAVPTHRGRLAVLSGPTFAREVAAGMPSGATVASEDRAVAAA